MAGLRPGHFVLVALQGGLTEGVAHGSSAKIWRNTLHYSAPRATLGGPLQNEVEAGNIIPRRMMMSPRSNKRPKTAAELEAVLKKDPDYQERIALKDRERSRTIADIELNSRPVLDDLEKIGINVTSLDELRTGCSRYEEAIPVLVSWLRVTESDKVKEALVRTLSVPWADTAEAPLVDLFLSLDSDRQHALKWAIGNALSVLAAKKNLDRLIEIARDRRHGTTRQMVVLGLANIPDERSESALIDLLADPEVAGHAIMALGKLRTAKAAASIRPFLKHKTPWVRAEARNALSLLESSPPGTGDEPLK
jgi:hypothetical protein